jgi:hypothetical protein
MKYFGLLLFLIIAHILCAAPVAPGLPIKYTGKIVKDTDTVVRKQSLSVGVAYGSDIQFFGRTGPITYPFMSTDAIYNTKNGFFLYTSAYKVLGYNPLVDEVDFGGGYLYNYSKAFTGTASYTHFFFDKDAAQVIQSASSNDFDWKNSYDWSIAKSSVVFDYLFGKENDYFVTINTSKYIETSWGIFDDKDYLSFNPTVAAILGTQNFVQRYSMDYQYRTDQNNILVHNPNNSHFGLDNGKFNALNYNFKIPIAYNRPHYTFEFSYKYSIPVNVEGLLMNKRESFYNLTFYYVFY